MQKKQKMDETYKGIMLIIKLISVSLAIVTIRNGIVIVRIWTTGVCSNMFEE